MRRALATALTPLVACVSTHAPAEAPPPVPSAGFVQAQAPTGTTAREQYLSVLRAAPVTRCYTALLQREPTAWGEVVVRITVGAAGEVRSAESHLATLPDEDTVRCVLAVARTLQFPTPPREGTTLLYPWVFTSDRTPPEAARALRIRYAGEAEVPPGDPHDPRGAPPPPGTITLW
jgi:hypothetical protein